MAYCKFCGMDSKTSDKCEWCGRGLAQSPAAKPPEPVVRTTAQIVEEQEEEGRKSRVAFYIANGALLVLAAIVIAVRKELYPSVIIGGLFVSGLMMGYFRVLPPFEGEWLEVGIVFLSIIFFPAIVAFLGYMAYGLITRSIDINIAWLLGTYVVMVIALEIVCIIAMLNRAPESFLWKLHAVEIIGFGAVLLGWITSGAFGVNR